MEEKAVEMYKERMSWDALGDRFLEVIGDNIPMIQPKISVLDGMLLCRHGL